MFPTPELPAALPEGDLSKAMLPAEAVDASLCEDNALLPIGDGEPESKPETRALQLVKAGDIGPASKKRKAVEKPLVKSVLEDLKAKLKDRKKGKDVEQPGAKDSKKAKIVADVAPEKQVEKVAKKQKTKAEKVDIPEKKQKEDSAEVTKAAKKQKKPEPAGKTSKVKAAEKKKKPSRGKTPELTAQQIEQLVLRVGLPEWFSCKQTLAEYFPKDTEKRFTSRCYHKTLEFEVKAGKSEEEAKGLARAMHRHAKGQWCTFFPSK